MFKYQKEKFNIMDSRWKEILALGVGVFATFKGLDYLTKKTFLSKYLAEDWSGELYDVPFAVNYFCASEVLKTNGQPSKKAVNTIRQALMRPELPFLNFDRKQTKVLIKMIQNRLRHYEELYYSEGELALRREIENTELRLMEVSSPELFDYMRREAFSAQLRGLPELAPTRKDRVRVRFAPNPNGPLSMGHSFGIIINDIYAKAYDGEYILRFDDTDPDQKRPLPELYSQIKEEFEFLTDRTPSEYKIHISSENSNRYISLARRLIEEGKAYVSFIPQGDFSEFYQRPMEKEGIESPDRNKSIETNLRQFDEMVQNGYYTDENGSTKKPTDNHIVGVGQTTVPTVWLKTPMDSYGKFRDIKIMRATFRTHPNIEGYVWPYLAFQGAVDDHDLKVSHMIRGCDLWETEIAYSLIWKELGWSLDELPVFMYWPRLFFSNFAVPYSDPQTGEPKLLRAIGTSKLARLVRLPEYDNNWCNPFFPTVCSYMAKGYPASYLRDFWMGEVWGKQFSFFNQGEITKDGKTYEPLTLKMREARCEMRTGQKSLGYFKNEQARVPYPLDANGNLRDAPSITLVDLQVGQPRPMAIMQAESSNTTSPYDGVWPSLS